MNGKELFRRLQPLIALIVMVVILSLTCGTQFLAVSNLRTILLQISVNLCLSIGMTLVILTGGIDLSVGAILAFAGALGAGLFKNGLALNFLGTQVQFTVFGAVIAGILAGAALGLHNGLLVTQLRLPPFIATLAMLCAARGFTMLLTDGHPVSALGAHFDFMGAGALAGVPMAIWISAVLAVVFQIFSHHTPLGRYIYAVGGSEKAAKFAGVNVKNVKLWVYTLAGALAGIAGLIQTARLDTAEPNAGLGYELDSIAAVVIGGTSLSGGRGSIFGTVLGCLIIGVLNNGLVLLGVSPFWQAVIKGYVIIAAVAIDNLSSRKQE
jgi:ribose transport system permease protein